MQLQTPRLILRNFHSEDVQAVLAYQRDPRFLRFSPWHDRTEDEVAAFVQRFVDWGLEEPRARYQLAITLASSGELIGNVGLRATDPSAEVAEIGYELAPAHWGRGYATEAAHALMELGFGAFGLRRIHSHCIADNVASARVLDRLGMRREGRLRQHEFFKERAWDVLLYGILASEWPAAARLHGAAPAAEAAPSSGATLLGRVVLLVREYDEALAFYGAALGARALFDQTTGDHRYLHIALPAQPAGELAEVGLWLLRATGDDLAAVGRQAGGHPFLVLYTADCRAATERFVSVGGRIRRPLREDPGSVYAHVEDLYGNELVLVQLRSG